MGGGLFQDETRLLPAKNKRGEMKGSKFPQGNLSKWDNSGQWGGDSRISQEILILQSKINRQKVPMYLRWFYMA